jgi:hypothetical protein
MKKAKIERKWPIKEGGPNPDADRYPQRPTEKERRAKKKLISYKA